jgi:hypothetical protein
MVSDTRRISASRVSFSILSNSPNVLGVGVNRKQRFKKTPVKIAPERWQSGRMRRIANPVSRFFAAPRVRISLSPLRGLQSVPIPIKPLQTQGFYYALSVGIIIKQQTTLSAIEFNQTHRMSAVSVNIGVNKTKKPNMGSHSSRHKSQGTFF